MVRTVHCFAAFAASAFDRELFAVAHVITPPKLVLCAGPDVPPTAARRAFTFVVFNARNSSPSIGTNPALIGACHGIAARGEGPASHRGRRGAPMTRRDDREYREYLREEQHSQRGCIAGRMQPEFHHGLLEGRSVHDGRLQGPPAR